MLRVHVCFGNRVFVYFKKHQRNYCQSWCSGKQPNHFKPISVRHCIQILGAKKTSPTLSYWCGQSGAPVTLFCFKGTYSSSTRSTPGENCKIYKQQNIVQEVGPAEDQNPSYSSNAETPDSGEHWGPYIVSQIHKLEESSRFYGHSMLKWGLSGFAVLLACIYLFRDRLRDNVADEVADVASRSMADENVILKAHGMTKGVLERLVSEPETITLVGDFIKEVLKNNDVRRTAADFAASILNNPDTQEKIQETTRNTIHSILNDEETKTMLLNFIKHLVQDQETKDACNQLLLSLTKDPNTQKMIADFFKSVLSSSEFQNEAVSLGRQVTDKLVHDRDIQKETGDALWSAVKYGVTPYWFREK